MTWSKNPCWKDAYAFAQHWTPVPGIKNFVDGRPENLKVEALGACIAAYWPAGRKMGMDKLAEVIAMVAGIHGLPFPEVLRASGNCNASQSVADVLEGVSAQHFGPSPDTVFGAGDWRLAYHP